MANRHKYSASLSWGGDEPTAEMEVEVSYTVLWGAPEQGPSYASGGQPADPDEIDDIQIIEVNGERWPPVRYLPHEVAHWADAIGEKLLDEHYDQMIAEAAERDADDYERTQDEKWERRL